MKELSLYREIILSVNFNSYDNSHCLYYDPHKSIKRANNDPKNRKHCFYCRSQCQVLLKNIGFAFWLLFSFDKKTEIESYNLTCGVCSTGFILKTNQ